jgi:hypothetical protein
MPAVQTKLAPFSVTKEGAINSISGVIGGAVIDATSISSPNYTQGASGWKINQDGTAEFQNVLVRGEIQAVVFSEQ